MYTVQTMNIIRCPRLINSDYKYCKAVQYWLVVSAYAPPLLLFDITIMYVLNYIDSTIFSVYLLLYQVVELFQSLLYYN